MEMQLIRAIEAIGDPLQEIGLSVEPGDLVIAVGHEAVGAPEEVQQKVAAAKKNGHKNVLVRVEREGSSRFIALPLEAG